MRLNMRRSKLFAALSAALISTAALSVLPASSVSAANTPSIVILGDSISSGYALAEGERGYYDYLGSALNGSVVNYAVPGDTTDDLLTKLAETEVNNAVQKADYICLSIGGNDLLKPTLAFFQSLQKEGEGMTDTLMRLAKEGKAEQYMSDLTGALTAPQASAQANIDTIASTLRTLNPNAEIVFQTLYNPVEVESPVYNGVDYSTQYKQLMNYVNGQIRRINKKIAARTDVKQADIYTAFNGSGWIYVRTLQKDVHPNALGHALIAATILDSMGKEGTAHSSYFDEILQNAAASAMPDAGKAEISKFTASSVKSVYGDVDGDSSVTVKDSLAVLKAAGDIRLGLEPALTAEQIQIADVDGDGRCTVKDAQYILVYYSNTRLQIECSWAGLTKNPNAPSESNLKG